MAKRNIPDAIAKGRLCILHTSYGDFELVFLTKRLGNFIIEVEFRKLAKFDGNEKLGLAISTTEDCEVSRFEEPPQIRYLRPVNADADVFKKVVLLLQHWGGDITISDWLEYIETVELKFGLDEDDFEVLKNLAFSFKGS